MICSSTNIQDVGSERTALLRCGDCSFVFSTYAPSTAELVQHYEGYSRDTSFTSECSIRRRREWLESYFEPYRKENRLLDVGCGVGQLLDQAREAGWNTFGTEFTDRAVAICRERGHAINQGPLDPSSYRRGSFDVIVYSEVIEHINNHREEFEYVYELLRPGGLLFLTTPNFNSLSRRILRDRWNVIQYPEHLAYFTPKTLRRLMCATGFRPVWIKTTGFSLTRFSASLVRGGQANSSERRKGAETADERLRSLLEYSAGAMVKAGVNKFLMAVRLGDSIKAGFEK